MRRQSALRVGLLLFFFIGNIAMVESVLSALEKAESIYDQLDPGEILRVNTVDVAYNLGFCRMVVLNPFTSIEKSNYIEYTGSDNMQYMAAVALALSHLNAGDGTVIPELEGLKCGVKFTMDVADTGFRESQAAKSVLSVLDRTHRRPCAFIGSAQTAVTAMSATLTTLREYPQICPLSSSPSLSDPERFRYLARLSPTAGEGWDGPDPLLEYLYTRLGVRHLTLAYEDESPTHSLIAWMAKNAKECYPDMSLKIVSMPNPGDMDQISSLITQIESTSFRYVFAAFSRNKYGRLFEAAVQKGIAGTESSYTWIWGNLGVEEYMWDQEFAISSPIFQALSGSLLYSRIGSAPEVGRYSAFVKEWERLVENIPDLEYLRSKIPEVDSPFRPVLDRDILSQQSPYFSLVPLYYDAAILAGLSACKTPDEPFQNGPEHFTAMLNTTFTGASGPILFNAESKARSQVTAMYRIWNFVPMKTLNGTAVLKKQQVASYANGTWTDPGEGVRIVFADSSPKIPSCLPAVVVNSNYIGNDIRKVGYAMTAIVLLISFSFSKWTIVCREQRIVRASQPIFLHLICIGTALMGLSIAVLSLDDETIGDMDLVCLSMPILPALGWCFAFSAILSKTLRVNIIFHNPRFKRIRVAPSDVMRPMLALLSTWSVLDPLHWRREAILFDEYGRTSESFGFCTSTHAVPYSCALLLVNIGVLAVTSFQSYVARNISTEFSESEYIAKAVGVVLLVSFMAIPIYQVSRENTQSRFLALSCSIFVISLSLLLLVFVPKMCYRGEGVKAGIRRSLHGRPSDYDEDKSLDLTRRSLDDDEDESDDSVGVMRVTAHPKLYKQLEEKLRVTKQENATLKKLVREIRQSQPKPSSVPTVARDAADSIPSTASTSNHEPSERKKNVLESKISDLSSKSQDSNDVKHAVVSPVCQQLADLPRESSLLAEKAYHIHTEDRLK